MAEEEQDPEQDPVKSVPPGCLMPMIVVGALFALLTAFCVANLGDSDKPSPVYERCAAALRANGYSEADPGWLPAVGRCMEGLSPSTTKR